MADWRTAEIARNLSRFEISLLTHRVYGQRLKTSSTQYLSKYLVYDNDLGPEMTVPG